MHELSLCRAIARIATEHARGRPVLAITLQVGQLRQVVPQTLIYCWKLVSENTPLAGSQLVVESIPALVECASCEGRQPLASVAVRCPACGSDDVAIAGGDEFLVKTLDLAEV